MHLIADHTLPIEFQISTMSLIFLGIITLGLSIALIYFSWQVLKYHCWKSVLINVVILVGISIAVLLVNFRANLIITLTLWLACRGLIGARYYKTHHNNNLDAFN
ncbi:MAG: hypothetical protein COA43_02430 [Robiginitomaculum sp.]|nr:MAG: hypothetical protein COA43_02430 [Robiginitomaculum sp.]